MAEANFTGPAKLVDVLQDTEFESRNVRYHFDFVGDRLKIGKFCALAQGTTFIMSGANHAHRLGKFVDLVQAQGIRNRAGAGVV